LDKDVPVCPAACRTAEVLRKEGIVGRRIAFISEHASPLAILGGTDSGGQNVYVDRVAHHLVKLGYEVDVFTRRDDASAPCTVSYMPGVRVIHIQAGPAEVLPKEQLFQHMDEFAISMIQFIQDRGIEYELIHAHFWMSGYVAGLVKTVLGIPFVITFHALGKLRRIFQGAADGFPDERFEVEERVVRQADRIIAECPQDKEDLMFHYYAPEDKISIIPCGFDSQEFYPVDKREAKRKLGLNPDEQVILQLGRMVPRKGVDNVIKGLSCVLARQDIPVRLLVVGGESDNPDPDETPEIGRLVKLAEEHHVQHSVTFTGRRGRNLLKYFYNAADIFVTTPWYEPFGITPLEAMACGTPVIGSSVGGIKYSVVHGKTGFLVPPNEPEILGKRMLDILTDRRLAESFRRNSLERVNSMFTWSIVARQIDGVYRELRKGRRQLAGISRFLPGLATILGIING
jgi:D-inositol-3-phosphate glycosyltransferase